MDLSFWAISGAFGASSLGGSVTSIVWDVTSPFSFFTVNLYEPLSKDVHGSISNFTRYSPWNTQCKIKLFDNKKKKM